MKILFLIIMINIALNNTSNAASIRDTTNNIIRNVCEIRRITHDQLMACLIRQILAQTNTKSRNIKN